MIHRLRCKLPSCTMEMLCPSDILCLYPLDTPQNASMVWCSFPCPHSIQTHPSPTANVVCVLMPACRQNDIQTVIGLGLLNTREEKNEQTKHKLLLEERSTESTLQEFWSLHTGGPRQSHEVNLLEVESIKAFLDVFASESSMSLKSKLSLGTQLAQRI